MKQAIPFLLLTLFYTFPGFSQLLSWSPDFIRESTTPVVITVDATKGNQGFIKLYTYYRCTCTHRGYHKFSVNSSMQTIKIVKVD